MAPALSSLLFRLLCEAPELGARKGAQDVQWKWQSGLGEVRVAAGEGAGSGGPFRAVAGVFQVNSGGLSMDTKYGYLFVIIIFFYQ